ncbi:MAG TPA: cytochrome c [Polyangia bacterium]|nr:cytochrome c [Polyangia bacterium]
MKRIAMGLVAFALLLLAPSARAQDKKAERTWKAKCASCHGEDGKAQTDQGKKMAVRDMTTPAWQKEFSDDQIRKAILDGIKTERDGKKKEMDPYKDKLKPEQIDALIPYIRSLAK